MDEALVETSRLATVLLAPSNLMAMLLALGVALLWSRWWRAGRALTSLAGLALVVVAVLPLSSLIASPLETRFPPLRQLPRSLSGIIVLGGALQPELAVDWAQPHLNQQAERIIAFARLGRERPDLQLVYAGGPAPGGDGPSEAALARELLGSLGMDTSRILFEDRSHNTYENAVHTAERLNPQADQTWLLVTTAMHMPRAVGVFRSAGFRVLAYPVDYRSRRVATFKVLPNLTANLERLDYAMHEWLGLTFYRLLGRTSTWFPAP